MSCFFGLLGFSLTLSRTHVPTVMDTESAPVLETQTGIPRGLCSPRVPVLPRPQSPVPRGLGSPCSQGPGPWGPPPCTVPNQTRLFVVGHASRSLSCGLLCPLRVEVTPPCRAGWAVSRQVGDSKQSFLWAIFPFYPLLYTGQIVRITNWFWPGRVGFLI